MKVGKRSFLWKRRTVLLVVVVLVNARGFFVDGYRSQLPMIVTTNLSLKKLKNPEDMARARIYDRVLERCMPVRVNDQNIRDLNKEANMEQAKRILGDI